MKGQGVPYLEHTVVLEKRYYLVSDLNTVHYENGTNGLLKALYVFKMFQQTSSLCSFSLSYFFRPLYPSGMVPLNGNQLSSFLSWQCNHRSSQMESFPCSRPCPKEGIQTSIQR